MVTTMNPRENKMVKVRDIAFQPPLRKQLK